MTRILAGTVSVTNGNANVTWTGSPLTDANCPADGQITIAGAAYFILSRTDSTHLVLTRNYAGTTSGSVVAEIDPLNANAISLVTVTRSIADYNAKLNLLDSRGHGLFYQCLGYTASGDPGPGRLARNNASWSSVTELYIDPIDASDTGVDQTGIINQWVSGTLVIIQSIETGDYAAYTMGLNSANQTGWFKLSNLTYVDGSGPADGEDIRVVFVLRGNGIYSTPRGAWDSATTYAALDFVEHGGYTFLSAVGGNLNHEPTVSPNPASSSYWTYMPLASPGDFLDLALFAQGHFDDGSLLLRVEFAGAATFPASLTGSKFSAGTAPGGSVALDLRKNGVSFGTVNFGAGLTEATFTAASNTTFNIGDVLSVYAPNPNDGSLGDVSGTLRGTRDASLSINQTGTAVLDFGSFPGKADTSTAITGIGRIASGSLVKAWLWPGSGTADHSVDEHLIAGIRVTPSAVVAGTGFAITGVATDSPGENGPRLYGQWNVAWQWF